MVHARLGLSAPCWVRLVPARLGIIVANPEKKVASFYSASSALVSSCRACYYPLRGWLAGLAGITATLETAGSCTNAVGFVLIATFVRPALYKRLSTRARPFPPSPSLLAETAIFWQPVLGAHFNHRPSSRGSSQLRRR